MKLKELLKDVHYELVQGDLELEVKDIAYDSRKVSDGVAFVAMKGFRVDGHDYVDNALEKGCKCFIVQDDISVPGDVTVVKLKDTRVDLSKLSRTLFNYPDEEMIVVAITGTKGKTTTSTMIRKMLEDSGKACGLIGTMGVFYKDKFYHTMNTSPESYDVFKYMREMIDNGVKYLVMEVSSQSLKLSRWSNVIFDYAVFTNLSLDHVGGDEHPDFDDYKRCKSKLFEQCKVGLFNIDDDYYEFMSGHCKGDIFTYGYDSRADYKLISADNMLNSSFIGIEMEVGGKIRGTFKVSIPGEFTAYNAVAAIGICSLLGLSVDEMKKSLLDVAVKGRLEPVSVSSKFHVLIDYAYQGVAMENILTTMKEAHPKRIVTVFGCGGNRSVQRRYDCGEIAGKYADLSILTADNPRYEDNNKIIEDILVGMNKVHGKYVIIPDRKEAIRYSIVNAEDGDIILILGKGHEDYQEIEGVRYPFDERVIIREIIDELSREDKDRLGIE